MITIRALPALDPVQRQQAIALRDAVNAADGLDLKLHLTADDAPPLDFDPVVVAEDGDELLGFATLTSDDPLELCGVVRPDARRQGIGAGLLAAALAQARRRGAAVLLICEDAAPGGRALVARTGAALDHREHRMVLGELHARPPRYADLVAAAATEADLPAVAHIEALAFGDAEDAALRFAQSVFGDAQTRIVLARLAGEPVASLRVVFEGDRALIYGVGVAPAWRDQGLGGQLLGGVLADLRAEGWQGIGLEVEPDNAPAVALYQALGFRTTTTYGYYRLPDA